MYVSSQEGNGTTCGFGFTVVIDTKLDDWNHQR